MRLVWGSPRKGNCKMQIIHKNWKCQFLSCKKCGLHRFRKHVVLGRGAPGSDILFVGEAPGRSENVIGMPFVGPSGKLLDKLVLRAAEMAKMDRPPRFYITNACACRPCDSREAENRAPTGEELWACFPRLEYEINHIAKPKRTIFLGKTAANACKKMIPNGLSLQHPAYILRCGGVSCPEGIRFSRDLSVLFEEIKNGV